MSVFLNPPAHPLVSTVRVEAYISADNPLPGETPLTTLPALTLIPHGQDFPVQDLRALAGNLVQVLNNQAPAAALDAQESFIHFERLEGGNVLLRPRSTGVSSEKGVMIVVHAAIPDALRNEIADKLNAKTLETLLGSITMGKGRAPGHTPAAEPAPQP